MNVLASLLLCCQLVAVCLGGKDESLFRSSGYNLAFATRPFCAHSCRIGVRVHRLTSHAVSSECWKAQARAHVLQFQVGTDLLGILLSQR